jgi:hypothetical protein
VLDIARVIPVHAAKGGRHFVEGLVDCSGVQSARAVRIFRGCACPIRQILQIRLK